MLTIFNNMNYARQALRVLSIIVFLLAPLTTVRAVTTPTILISEIQTGSSASASEEFIELINVTDTAIDISTYRLEYFSAGSTNFDSPSRTIALHGTLYAGKHYLVSSTGYLATEADEQYAATLAKTGGHVRLLSQADGSSTVQVYDLVGWGTALQPETVAVTAPAEGQSLQRKSDSSGTLIDSDNNAADFEINTTPSPVSDNEPPVDEEPTEEPAADPPVTPEPETPPVDEEPEAEIPAPEPELLPLQITELLPNPAPPQTDDADEFVEIYNPNPNTVNLGGYKLQTGNSFSYSYTFTTETIAGNTYTAFFVTQTDTLLANSGGKARLIDADGQIISEVVVYEDADDGLAWAYVNGSWQWTTTPTPSAANILTQKAEKETIKTAVTKKVKTSAKKSTAKKVKATKTAQKKKAPVTRAAYEEPEIVPEAAPLHPSVLAGVGSITLTYAAYEYRHDVANRVYKFRRYRATRGKLRSEP